MRCCIPILMIFLSGCSDAAWHLAQTPAFSGFNDRMNERALERSISSDPIAQLQQNTKGGDTFFRGIMLIESDKTWIPGIGDSESNKLKTMYICFEKDSPLLPKAESFYSTYNKALQKQTEQGAAANP
jgi:hypothetical protein